MKPLLYTVTASGSGNSVGPNMSEAVAGFAPANAFAPIGSLVIRTVRLHAIPIVDLKSGMGTLFLTKDEYKETICTN